MKKVILIITILYFSNVAYTQTLQTVTTTGNTTTNALRLSGDDNSGPTGTAELILGLLNSNKTNDTRAFIGWKNNGNTITDGLAGTLLLQGRSDIGSPIDFATGIGMPLLRMRIAGDGKIGIGTNLPNALLNLKGAGSTNTTTSLLIQNSSNTEAFRVLDNGNVGLGTTPVSKLHIAGIGTTATAPILILQNWIGTGLVGSLRFASGYNNFDSWSGIEAYGNGGVDIQDLRFYTTYGSRAERMRINEWGYIGIGTTTPSYKLTIYGGGIRADLNASGSSLITTGTGSNFQVIHNDASNVGLFNSGGGVQIRKADGITSIATFNVSGNVGIGTATPNASASLDVVGNIFTNSKIVIGTTDMAKVGTYSLAVNGNAIFTKAVVKLNANWPDYVFDDKYNLLPLPEVEKFLKVNRHLPEVPSAAEIAKDGIDLGNNQTILLQKIEELTLYAIDHNKQIFDLDKKIINQQEQINILIQEVEVLKKAQRK